MAENVEYIPLRKINEFDDWDSDKIEGTNLDDNDEDETTNLLGNNNPETNDDSRNFDILSSLDWVANKGKDPLDVSKRLFGDRVNEARNLGNFMEEVMDKPIEYRDLRFIKYLMDKHNFKLIRTVSFNDLSSNYDIEYYGKPYLNENGVVQRPARVFHVVDGEFQTADEDLSGNC